MNDNEPEDPEIRKLEREYKHEEKRLEETSEMLKEAPELLGVLTQDVIIPLISSIQAKQWKMWTPPENARRGEPNYEPDPETQDGGGTSAGNVRKNLDLEPAENGGEDA